MTVIEDYYGTSKEWKTFLEIYSTSYTRKKKVIHRQLSDQEAYDTWHLSFYLKEIFTYKRLLQKKRITFNSLPRKEKNLLLYLLMLAMDSKLTIVELGHSLFELIDGLEVVERYFHNRKYRQYVLTPDKYKYIGIDISDDLCLASKILHPKYDIKTYPGVKKMNKTFSLLYDRNVSSYAFTTSEDLAKFINKSDVALMDLFVSKGETFMSSRLGKSLTYFSLRELMAHLNKPLYHLFGEKAPGPYKGAELSAGKPVIEGFFLYASEKNARKFMDISMKIPEVKKYIHDKKISLTDASELLKTSGKHGVRKPII